MPKDVTRVAAAARRLLGFAELRPGQAEAIRAVLAGRDTLAVMPTGGGKSAIYQVAAAQLEGPTVVVSPLLALQRDQARAIRGTRAGEAVAVNSTLSAGRQRRALHEVMDGEVEFLFVSPEQLARPEVLRRIEAARPSLFVVDEAHCVTEWGHDFRPDYLKLGRVIEELGHPVVLALTATAAPPVRREIVQRLRMREPAIVIRGFDRPNIRLDVRRFADRDAKREAVLEHVRAASGSGIVYVATRRAAGELARALVRRGIRAAAYHAALPSAERVRIERAFRDGSVRVVVATKAFGMGIDKRDVRFVFHHDASESLDAYYQEVGRAGRDGAPAHAMLFFCAKDLTLQRFLGSRGVATGADVARVAGALRRRAAPDPERLSRRLELSRARVETALALIEDSEPGKAAATQDRHREIARSRLEMVRQYAEGTTCLRAVLLSYFGEVAPPRCGACGRCDEGRVAEREPARGPFPLQGRVSHPGWGRGTVLRYEGPNVVVLFDDAGYRTLYLPVVRRQRLLKAV